LRSKGFLACKDARGSEEISNLALSLTACWHMKERKNKRQAQLVATGSTQMQERPRQLAVVWKGLFFLQEFAEKSSEHTARA